MTRIPKPSGTKNSKPIKKPEITNKEKEILDKIKGKSKGAPEEGEGEEESKEEGEK